MRLCAAPQALAIFATSHFWAGVNGFDHAPTESLHSRIATFRRGRTLINLYGSSEVAADATCYVLTWPRDAEAAVHHRIFLVEAARLTVAFEREHAAVVGLGDEQARVGRAEALVKHHVNAGARRKQRPCGGILSLQRGTMSIPG